MGLHPDMSAQVDETYTQLEAASRLLQAVKRQLLGFTAIIDPYKEMYAILVPNRPIDTGFGKLPLHIIMKGIGAFILPFILLFLGLPLISGLMRIPWKETFLIFACIFLLYLVTLAKKYFGVSN